MIGLAFAFDLGRYHANPWGAHVNEASVEWPPSPWRIIRALYSTVRTDVRFAGEVEHVDRALEALVSAPPPVFELPPATPGHTRHYMPLTTSRPGMVFDGFLAVDPESEVRVWWDASLDGMAASALSAVARALPYLGRSESLCTARLLAGEGPREISAAPAEDGSVLDGDVELTSVLCPEAGRPLADFAVSVADLRDDGLLVPPGSRRVAYAVKRFTAPVAPRRDDAERGARPTVALFRVSGGDRPPMTEAVSVGHALRQAVQSRFGQLTDGGASPTFSGHDGDRHRTDQHRHGHYLALSDRTGRRVERLVVWAPEGFGADEVAALARVTDVRVWLGDDRTVTSMCLLGALGTSSELTLPELLGPAVEWCSRTPFGLIRHPKRRRGRIVDGPEEQVRRELSFRGFPDPVAVMIEKGSWHRFQAARSGTSQLRRTGLYGIRLRFAEPVHGPIAIGALSHFGLGLMRPVSEG